MKNEWSSANVNLYTWSMSAVPHLRKHNRIRFRYGLRFWAWPLVFANRIRHKRLYQHWRDAKRKGTI